MSFDNKQLCINGEGLELLKKAIEIAFLQHDDDGRGKLRSWDVNPKVGLILKWCGDKLPEPGMDAEATALLVWNWLKSEEASRIPTDGLDSFKVDMDGDIDTGWKVWVGEGAGCHDVLCAVKPVAIWRGK